MPVYHAVQDQQQLAINTQSCQRLSLPHTGQSYKMCKPECGVCMDRIALL